MLDIVTWPNGSGLRYRTELYQIGTTFNPVPGVYILCKDFGIPDHWKALYVGETNSLFRRLNKDGFSHDGYFRAMMSGATHVAAMVVEGDRANRLNIETNLRRWTSPPCNLQPVPQKGLGSLFAANS